MARRGTEPLVLGLGAGLQQEVRVGTLLRGKDRTEVKHFERNYVKRWLRRVVLVRKVKG